MKEPAGILSREHDRIIWEGEGELLWMEPYGKDSVRVRASKSLHIDENLDWNLREAEKNAAEITCTAAEAVIKNGELTAVINESGTVRFYKKNGEILLEESWLDFRELTVPLRRAREYRSIASRSFETQVYFKAGDGEHFYGMGQHPNNCLDLKGTVIELSHKNTQASIPFLLSSKGYGFVWNNPAIGRAELTKNHTMWHAEATPQIDYLVMGGDSPDKIMEIYTGLYGRAPLLPEFASGFWQCKLRYRTQDELLNVAREYKRRRLPISVIVIDYFHWPQQGDWKFDERYWPDPKAMVDELKSMGIELMVSVWPTVDPQSENFEMLRKNNGLIRAERGNSVFFMFKGPETYYDATNPKARQMAWDIIKKNYYDLGVKHFWLDESEPEMRPYHYENVRYYAGNGLEVSNIYPYMYAKTFQDGLQQEHEEVLNLSRCAWLGSQTLGCVLWSGDIASTFESLRKQVKAGLNAGIAGMPWWTTDIGGFFGGAPGDESFRELLIRWFQFGLFCPVFRLHGVREPYVASDHGEEGSGGPNEVWSFGDRAYDIICSLLQLREKLKPYIMKQMNRASEKGTPPMRPLFYDFPQDGRCYTVEDSFLFGPDILVAPVLYAGHTERSVYLPQGVQWRDVSTGKIHEGGITLKAKAPLETIPLFVRDGAGALPF